MSVLVPYKITLLSNGDGYGSGDGSVLVPYKITLLSNPGSHHGNVLQF